MKGISEKMLDKVIGLLRKKEAEGLSGVTLIEYLVRSGINERSARLALKAIAQGKAKPEAEAEAAETPLERAERLFDLGYNLTEVATIMGVSKQALHDRLRRAVLREQVGKRFAQKLTEKYGPELGARAAEAMRKVAALDRGSFAYTRHAVRMLLMPAATIPEDERIARLSKMLREALRPTSQGGVGDVKIEGRKLADELRDVAGYALRMVREGTAQEYRDAWDKGGPFEMLGLAQARVQRIAPIDPQTVQDVLSSIQLAETQAAARGTLLGADEQATGVPKVPFSDLVGRREAARFNAATKRLRRLSRRVDKTEFFEALEAERAHTEGLHGEVRTFEAEALAAVARDITAKEKLRKEHKARIAAILDLEPALLEKRMASAPRKLYGNYLRFREAVRRALSHDLGRKPTWEEFETAVRERLAELGISEPPEPPPGVKPLHKLPPKRQKPGQATATGVDTKTESRLRKLLELAQSKNLGESMAAKAAIERVSKRSGVSKDALRRLMKR